MMSPHLCRIVVEGLDHPESVTIGPDGTIFTGGEAGQLYRIPRGVPPVEQFAATGGFIGGLAVDASSVVYACDFIRGQVLRVNPAGEVSVYSDGGAAGPITFPNFPVFDASGNLYVTDSGHYDRVDGRILVVRRDGMTESLTPPILHYPNGLALADGWLYVAESTAAAIVRFPLQPGGTVGPAELYALLPGTVPDGLAFAANGNLYVGCYTPDVIYCIPPASRLPEVLVADPLADRLNRPTNLAFTAQGELLFANLGGYHLGAVDIGEAGAPLHYPVM